MDASYVSRRNFIGAAASTFVLGKFVASARASTPLDLKIVRTFDDSRCVTGELICDGRFVCHTLERPFTIDQDGVKCIPDGNYRVFLHYKTPDAQHAASGIYWRMELNWNDTKPRTAIQIHIGNKVDDSVGCILLGTNVVNKTANVENSARAISALEKVFYGTSSPNMTPDKHVSLSISSLPKPTEYWITDPDPRPSVVRQDGLRWILEADGKTSYMFDEVRRTDAHIIFTGAPATWAAGRFVRYGLHGGKMEISKDGSKWRDFDEGAKVTRKDSVMKFITA